MFEIPNDLTKVRVLPSPFNSGHKDVSIQDEAVFDFSTPVLDETETGADLRSWQAIGKPPVNSAFGQNPGPKTSHGVKHSGKYFLGLDWFEATLLGKFVSIDPDDIERPLVNSAFDAPKGQRAGRVVLYHNQASRRNRHYRYGFDVLFVPAGAKVSTNRAAMVASYKIGVMSSVPHLGNNCKPGSSIFQAENNILYRSDLWPTIDATFAALGADVSHITRLDIALDGFGLLDAADRYYRDEMAVKLDYAENQTLAQVGKAGFTVDRFEDGGVTNFYIGSMSSKKTLNGYAKGQRIDVENKQYIRGAWLASGLIQNEADGKTVTRLEMRHRKEALDELHLVDLDTGEALPFDWRRLRDARYLAGMFKETLRNFYGFKVVNPTDKDKSRWEDVPTIDWDAFDTAKVVRIGRTRTPSETWRAKHGALKIIRDDAANDYLAEAVREEIQSAPSYEVPAGLAAELAAEITDNAPKISADAARSIVATIAAKLGKDAVQYVTAWSADNIPSALGWAMAEEHSVLGYIENRLRQDAQDGNDNIRFMNPAPLAATA
jgi:hypothetical protein